MTRILTSADRFAREALAGFAGAHPSYVRAVPGGAIRAGSSSANKVALVIGGGSGHYPAFPGFVGNGLADAAVTGDVFTSPSTRQIVGVARQASRGTGVVLGFGNYAGDVLNFRSAAQQLNEEGIPARTIAVADDIASAPAADASARRGIAGGLVVFKVAGAAAESGAPLDSVVEIAERCNAQTRTLGVAFSGCTLPGAAAPLFTVPPGRMGVGLGIHGEPGIEEADLVDASVLAEILVGRLLEDALPQRLGLRVAAVLNGLGATKYEELFVLWHHVAERLSASGLTVVAPEVGEFYTSLDMYGCSLTLTWLDEELEPLWTAPVDAPALRRAATGSRPASSEVASGGVEESQSIRCERPSTLPDSCPAPSTAASRASAGVVVSVLDAIATQLRKIEADLGQLDAWAGDGDHGSGMVRGSVAARDAARRAVEVGAGVASTLVAAADAWADKAGGTSGALWGVLLRAWAGAYSDDRQANGNATVIGAQEAAKAVIAAGGARVGDKTMVDALVPFVEELAGAVDAGATLAEAWCQAAERSVAGAAATAGLRPRLGRARPLAERSMGHPDPGAVSFAECARAAAIPIGSFDRSRRVNVDIALPSEPTSPDAGPRLARWKPGP